MHEADFKKSTVTLKMLKFFCSFYCFRYGFLYIRIIYRCINFIIMVLYQLYKQPTDRYDKYAGPEFDFH